MNILLVEDNQKLSTNIQTVLRLEQYTVDAVYEYANAQEKTSSHSYDLIILDLALPDGDGISFCRELRNSGYLGPILMLTARITLESKVAGLDSGADDYLTKPFLMEELLARVRALIRRTSGVKTTVVAIGAMEVDLSRKTIVKNGRQVDVSPIEFRLLEFFLLRRGAVHTASSIYESVWGNGDEDILFSETLKVHLSRLRKKIGSQVIRTVPGFGYIID